MKKCFNLNSNNKRNGSILMSHESGLTPHEKVLIPHVSGLTPHEI